MHSRPPLFPHDRLFFAGLNSSGKASDPLIGERYMSLFSCHPMVILPEGGATVRSQSSRLSLLTVDHGLNTRTVAIS